MSLPSLYPLVVCLGAFALVAGCDTPESDPTVRPDAAGVDTMGSPLVDSLATTEHEVGPDTLVVSGVAVATARLEPESDREVRGVVILSQLDGGVRVRAEIDGLRETRLHGLQVLRATSCEDADPDVHLGHDLGTPHGGPYRLAVNRHVGDLGNVRGGNGGGRYDRIDTVLRLNGMHSPVGRAVVIRAETDDATSPGGGAGDVLACGILQPGR